MIFGLRTVAEWKVPPFTVKFLSYVIAEVCYLNAEITTGLKAITISRKLPGASMVDRKNRFRGCFFWKRPLLAQTRKKTMPGAAF